jgi:hypothetical protein
MRGEGSAPVETGGEEPTAGEVEPEEAPETEEQHHAAVAPAGSGGNKPGGGGGEGARSHGTARPHEGAAKPHRSAKADDAIAEEKVAASPGPSSVPHLTASIAGGSSPMVPILIAVIVLAALSIGVAYGFQRRSEEGLGGRPHSA